MEVGIKFKYLINFCGATIIVSGSILIITNRREKIKKFQFYFLFLYKF